MAKSKPPPRRKGYDVGGSVREGMSGVMQSAYMAKMLQGTGAGGGGPGGSGNPVKPGGSSDPTKAGPDTDSTTLGDAYARGGRIKHTSGPRIGKDDGLIPAQRGEYVVRKAAVKKLGTKVLGKINQGKLPSGRGR